MNEQICSDIANAVRQNQKGDKYEPKRNNLF